MSVCLSIVIWSLNDLCSVRVSSTRWHTCVMCLFVWNNSHVILLQKAKSRSYKKTVMLSVLQCTEILDFFFYKNAVVPF